MKGTTVFPRVEAVRRGIAAPQALVIVAHGGAAANRSPAHRGRLTYAWQLVFSRWMVKAVVHTSTQVWRLRYRYRGWNGAVADAAQDLRWAVREAQRHHPGRPVILVGHSMGGRACVYAADEPNVAAICLLAPWLEKGDPIERLAGKPTLIVHGTADRLTNPRTSQAVAAEVGAQFVAIAGDGHTMARQPRRWREPVSVFVREQIVGGEPPERRD